jgi:hypothetical protein
LAGSFDRSLSREKELLNFSEALSALPIPFQKQADLFQRIIGMYNPY